MRYRTLAIGTVFLLLFFTSCGESPKKGNDKVGEKITKPDSLSPPPKDSLVKEGEIEEVQDEPFLLTEEKAIESFFDYGKYLRQDRVKITTSMGRFTIELFDDVAYLEAKFIF